MEIVIIMAMKEGIIRNLRKFIVLILLGIGGGTFFLFKNVPSKKEPLIIPWSKEKGYFHRLKILGYPFGNVPYLNVIIEDKTIPAKIDLGFQGKFSLPSDLINDIAEKKWIERIKSYGVRGILHEKDVYEVKNINIQNMYFFPVSIEEECLEGMHEGLLSGTRHPDDHLGKIGWGLFSKFNLLIDCRYSILAVCDSLETLKKQGYPVHSFIETPLTSNFCIQIEAQTEKGPLSCILDTGCTLNTLNKDFENENNHRLPFGEDLSLFNPENKDLLIFNERDTQELSSFKIEGREFGPLTFEQIKTPFDVDVILGMEFFDSNLVFIDFDNQKVYIFPYTGQKEVSIGRKIISLPTKSESQE